MEYAGIGSRETPEAITNVMIVIASVLEIKGYILRSGGADGADSAFEAGVHNKQNKKIYLPWKGFNNSDSHLFLESFSKELRDRATEIAIKYYHSKSMPEKTLKYMSRNGFQVLGDDLNSPADFIICYTRNGKASGGTGQALRIAKDLGIKVYNLFHESDKKELIAFIDSLPDALF